jgi:hypothetical protein
VAGREFKTEFGDIGIHAQYLNLLKKMLNEQCACSVISVKTVHRYTVRAQSRSNIMSLSLYVGARD